MKWEDYDDLVIKHGGRSWPQQSAWISPSKGEWEHVGYIMPGGVFVPDYAQGHLSKYGGRYYYDQPALQGGMIIPIWTTPNPQMDPHKWRLAVQATTTVGPTAPPPPPPARRPPPQVVRQPQPRQPPQVVRQPQPRQPQVPARRPQVQVPQQWVARGNPPHAYLGSRNLGLLINDHQVVQPTNGGRLWALYNLSPDGKISFVDRYGSVPGAPPPPNAHVNDQPRQFQPPPARRPQPQYVYPQEEPQYAYPSADPLLPAVYDQGYGPPVYVPVQPPPPPAQYVYVQPPAYEQGYDVPTYAPAQPVYEQPQVYDYGQPQQTMDPATAAYLGAQLGVEQALEALEGQVQVQVDTGTYDPYSQVEAYDPMSAYAGYGLY